ncbi:hypothetical protein PVAP13_5KG129774 [Panicum virgatum]|uniref:Uncharacterized protein n=1 Tax=Panicum virgatum TaxID=38727 RepID=A0A8T0SCQ6_PANVG|nr:hypothetical protein PVAP13_5KG129774 [Panicum virgatum]
MMAAALGRGTAAGTKGGGKQVGGRVLFVAVGCFLFFLVLLLSARPDATVVLGGRNQAVSLSSDSSSGGLALSGSGAVVRPRPRVGSHGDPQRSAERSSAMAATERVNDAVIGGGERNGDVERDAAPEEAERESNVAAAAATPSSDERAEPPAAAEDADRDKSLRAAVQTTPPPPHGLPADDTTTRADAAGRQQRRPPLCDTSGFRADVCELAGDVRLDANASAFVVVDGDGDGDADGAEYKVRPYPRKGDATSMGRVTEIAVRAAVGAGVQPPRCTATHAEPAVAFSIGGYTGNLFHDFTDVIVPLYGAAQRYRGDARLVVADAAPRWLAK